ncbi:MAG: hypothetical protein WBZ04_07110 [Candidatus Nanopelagicales bacterium]
MNASKPLTIALATLALTGGTCASAVLTEVAPATAAAPTGHHHQVPNYSESLLRNPVLLNQTNSTLRFEFDGAAGKGSADVAPGQEVFLRRTVTVMKVYDAATGKVMMDWHDLQVQYEPGTRTIVTSEKASVTDVATGSTTNLEAYMFRYAYTTFDTYKVKFQPAMDARATPQVGMPDINTTNITIMPTGQSS